MPSKCEHGNSDIDQSQFVSNNHSTPSYYSNSIVQNVNSNLVGIFSNKGKVAHLDGKPQRENMFLLLFCFSSFLYKIIVSLSTVNGSSAEIWYCEALLFNKFGFIILLFLCVC